MEQKEYAGLAPGMIIRRPLHTKGPLRALWRRLYRHFGVYVGAGRIVHFWGEGKKAHHIFIRRTSLAAFLDGEPISVHKAPVSTAHARAIVAEAERHVHDDWGEYSLCWHNCEDFAKHCYTVEY